MEKRTTQECARADGTKFVIDFTERGSNTLLVVLGGYNYTLRNPLLHYLNTISAEHGFDQMGFDLQYYSNAVASGLDDSGMDEYFAADIEVIGGNCKSPFCRLPRVKLQITEMAQLFLRYIYGDLLQRSPAFVWRLLKEAHRTKYFRSD